jgi:hypothetical protein
MGVFFDQNKARGTGRAHPLEYFCPWLLFIFYRCQRVSLRLPNAFVRRPAILSCHCRSAADDCSQHECNHKVRDKLVPSHGVTAIQKLNFRATWPMRGGAAFSTCPKVASLMFPSTEPFG